MPTTNDILKELRKQLPQELQPTTKEVEEPADTKYCICGQPYKPHYATGELWCPLCGTYLQSRRKPITRTTTEQTTKPTPKTYKSIRYPYIQNLTQQIADDYGIEITIKWGHGQCCYHRRIKTTHIMYFSDANIEYHKDRGLEEYVSVAHIWPRNMSPKQVEWALVLHEMAHCIVSYRGLRVRGIQHGREWVKTVKELQQKYPFSH